MSGFEWDGSVGAARLTTGQTKQVLSCSQELIVLLDQRRDWIRCVMTMYPTLPAILQPVIHTEHYFKKFQRDFVLKYQPKSDVWLLCFMPKPQDPPPNGNDDVGIARVAAKPVTVEAGCIVREKRGTRGEIGARIALVFAAIAALLHRWRRAPDFGHAREAVLRNMERFEASFREAQQKLSAARAQLLERRDEILGAIATWQTQIAESAVQDSFANGRFERRTIRLAGGIEIQVSTIVYDRIDWDSWLFGRRIDEDLLLD